MASPPRRRILAGIWTAANRTPCRDCSGRRQSLRGMQLRSSRSSSIRGSISLSMYHRGWSGGSRRFARIARSTCRSIGASSTSLMSIAFLRPRSGGRPGVRRCASGRREISSKVFEATGKQRTCSLSFRLPSTPFRSLRPGKAEATRNMGETRLTMVWSGLWRVRWPRAKAEATCVRVERGAG